MSFSKEQAMQIWRWVEDIWATIIGGPGLAVDVTDRAARDLGKVDAAHLDEYTPIDVDTGAGTVTAMPVTWRKTAANGPEFGTATDPVMVGQGTAAAALAGWPTKDDGPAWVTSWGTDADGTPLTSANLSGAAADATLAPTGGQKLVIDDILVSADTAMRITFTEETSNKVRGYARVAANGTVQVTWRGKMKLLAADKKLRAQASVAGNVEILVGYHSEA